MLAYYCCFAANSFRIFNLKILDEIKTNHKGKSQNDLERITTEFVNSVQNNIENFSFNKIIANFHEVYSSINKIINSEISPETWIENYTKILITMSPVIPHFSCECLKNLNMTNPKNTFYWPKINKKILITDKINFVIQINGKTRGVLETKADLKEKDILENIRNNQK